MDGYQRAARLLMDHPVSADVYWQEDGLWRDAVEKFGEPAVMALGDGDSRLAAYLTRVQFQWHQGQAELDAPRPVPTYEEIKQSITPPPLKGYVSLSWDKRLAPKVIRQLEEDMKQETHPDVLCRYLHLFQFVRRLPDLAPFLNLTRHADPTVVRRAVRVLERTTHSSIRARAGELLSGTSPDDVRNGIELLVANPGSGDYPHIADAVYRAGDQGQDALHTVTLAARDYLRAHAAPERVPIALFLYENIVCTQCRTAAVEVLKDADALPGWLRAEARWDAELEIRALVAG